jgi:hypothetical protein
MQSSDYVFFHRRKYDLIDVEAGKQIIKFANFSNQIYNEINVISTACWRGYTANYYINKGLLYGIKIHEIYLEKTEGYKEIKSNKIFIPYTGSCIIAYGDARCSDFIECYLDYEEAFELYFENGLLKEKLTLISAISKFNKLAETNDYRNNMEPNERGQLREQIAREFLKYNYDKWRSYKWRNDNDKKEEENENG